MKIKTILTISLILIGLSLNAQQDSIYKLDINQAVEFAIENNINVKNAELDIRKAKWKVWETTAIGLPQVSASSQYQNFPKIPVQLMPNFITPVVMGVNAQYYGLTPIAPPPEDSEKMPVQFGSKHNLDWGISVSQLLFSGEYIVGLKAAKTYKHISEQNFEKAKIELKASVKQAYYLALIAKQSRQILEQNYSNILSLSEKTQKMVDQGVSSQTQADQIKILELNMKNQISSLKRQEILSILMLKVQLGMVPNDSLVLTSTIAQIKSELSLGILSQNFNINENINYQMLNTQVELAILDLRRAQSQALPQVAAFYSYQKKAMENEFTFFDDGTEWFPTAVWGIKVSVPLFGSGQKYSVNKQKHIEVLKTQNQKTLITQQLYLQFEQAKSNYINAFENLLNQDKNKALSENIYNNTQIQFQEGTSSSMDLTQAQNQYLQAESNYYQALLQLLNAKNSLDQILNNN